MRAFTCLGWLATLSLFLVAPGITTLFSFAVCGVATVAVWCQKEES